ncbi:MAG: glycosyltransferase [Pseudomonadota bacterium]|nr:glycosyltransferase [Pseudomonadota bacterium]
MKVLQVLPELNTGGVERGTLDLAKELVKNGYRSYVISSGGIQVEALENQGSIHIQMPVARKHFMTLLQVKRLREVILEMQPDIIHVRSRMPAWMVFLALRVLPKNKRPVLVSTFHGIYSKPYYSQVMTFADHIISVSDTVTEYITNTYKVDKKNITRIYRGCDTEVFNRKVLDDEWKNKWYTEFPQTKGKKLLTLPARVTKWKGIDTMLDLISSLDDEYHALIVGPVNTNKHRYWEALNSIIKAKRIQSRVTFSGARNDIDNIYRLSSIVYNLSTQPEPFGRTMCEACNVGTKVIAWASAGPKESLSAMFPDGLIEPGNMQMLIEKTKEISDKKDLIPKEDIFTSQKMTSQTISLYQNLLFARAHSETSTVG